MTVEVCVCVYTQPQQSSSFHSYLTRKISLAVVQFFILQKAPCNLHHAIPTRPPLTLILLNPQAGIRKGRILHCSCCCCYQGEKSEKLDMFVDWRAVRSGERANTGGGYDDYNDYLLFFLYPPCACCFLLFIVVADAAVASFKHHKVKFVKE